jgi:hypothetical protein
VKLNNRKPRQITYTNVELRFPNISLSYLSLASREGLFSNTDRD